MSWSLSRSSSNLIELGLKLGLGLELDHISVSEYFAMPVFIILLIDRFSGRENRNVHTYDFWRFCHARFEYFTNRSISWTRKLNFQSKEIETDTTWYGKFYEKNETAQKIIKMVMPKISGDFDMPNLSILLIGRFPGRENWIFNQRKSKPTQLDTENFIRKTKPLKNIKKWSCWRFLKILTCQISIFY